MIACEFTSYTCKKCIIFLFKEQNLPLAKIKNKNLPNQFGEGKKKSASSFYNIKKPVVSVLYPNKKKVPHQLRYSTVDSEMFAGFLILRILRMAFSPQKLNPANKGFNMYANALYIGRGPGSAKI